MLVFVWTRGSLRGPQACSWSALCLRCLCSPLLGCLGSPWHLEHHCNRKKMGIERKKKLLFHFSTQWDTPLGLLTLENMLIMNMLNKYAYFFWGDNRTQCETLIQPHLNRKFIPSLRKEKVLFSTDSCFVSGKVRKQWRGQRNSAMDLEAIISSFQNFSPFFKLRIQSVNLTTHQSRDTGHPVFYTHILT